MENYRKPTVYTCHINNLNEILMKNAEMKLEMQDYDTTVSGRVV